MKIEMINNTDYFQDVPNILLQYSNNSILEQT